LWSIGFEYDPELIRTTLVEELRRFEVLIRNRGEQMFQTRESSTTDVPSKPEYEALEDLIDAHQARIIRAGLEPYKVGQELNLLLRGPEGSESLLDRIKTAVGEATMPDLDRMRAEARVLLLFYISHESFRRQMIQAISSASPGFAEAGLEDLGKTLQTEYAQLEDAWRHLIYFPILAAYLIHSQRSPDPEIIKWRTSVLPQYVQLTSWDTLPPAVKEAARDPSPEDTDPPA
jgi:hypothetical protein